MKKLILVTLVVALSGCATDRGQLAGIAMRAALQTITTPTTRVPDPVSEMMRFSNRETATVNACILAQQKAGFKPIGQRKELTLVQSTSDGIKSYKVTVAGLAAFQVPTDALATQSPELVKMLRTFGTYVAKRNETSKIVVTATTRSDVNFMRDTIAASAPSLEIATTVKPAELPMISFVSTGPTTRKLF